MVTEKALKNRAEFIKFVDEQPASTSAAKILKKYRAQGGHIDHNFAFAYVTEMSEKYTRLDYVVVFDSPTPSLIDHQIYTYFLSKRDMRAEAQKFLHAFTQAKEIHLKFQKTAIRSTTGESWTVGSPTRFDFARP
jgi:hypothetical protein